MCPTVLCAQIDPSDFQVTDSSGQVWPILSAEPVSCNPSFSQFISLVLDTVIQPSNLLQLQVGLTQNWIPLCTPDSLITISPPTSFNDLRTTIIMAEPLNQDSLCLGDSVLLTHTLAGEPGFQTTWFPGNIVSDELWVEADFGLAYGVRVSHPASPLIARDTFSLPVWSGGTLSWDVDIDTFLCADRVLISLTDTLASYQWSTGATTASAWIDNSQSGDIVVTVSNEWGCEATDTFRVDVWGEPYADLEVNILPDQRTVEFISNAVFTDSVQWAFGDGINAWGENQTYTYLQPGTYEASAVLWGTCGLAIETITVQLLPTSVETFGASDMAVWLFQSNLHLHMPSSVPSPAMLVLSDLTGKTVWQSSISGNQGEYQWDLGNLPKGVYLVSLSDSDGRLRSMSKLLHF